jgi:YXWGXW repeat-containing protein
MRQQSSSSSRGSRARRIVLCVALAAGATLAVAADARDAAAEEHVVVRVAPPTPRVEVIPRAPSSHHVWAPGYWGWHAQENRHVWYGGRWVVGQPGYAWEPAHWSEHGGYWHFVEGHWRRR